MVTVLLCGTMTVLVMDIWPRLMVTVRSGYTSWDGANARLNRLSVCTTPLGYLHSEFEKTCRMSKIYWELSEECDHWNISSDDTVITSLDYTRKSQNDPGPNRLLVTLRWPCWYGHPILHILRREPLVQNHPGCRRQMVLLECPGNRLQWKNSRGTYSYLSFSLLSWNSSKHLLPSVRYAVVRPLPSKSLLAGASLVILGTLAVTVTVFLDQHVARHDQLGQRKDEFSQSISSSKSVRTCVLFWNAGSTTLRIQFWGKQASPTVTRG